MDRNQVKEIVYSWEQYEADPPPESLLAFCHWVQVIINKIPNEHRRLATMKIGSSTSYDSSYATIEVSYWRPMTEGEIRIQDEIAAQNNSQTRAKELQLLATLKAKYES